MFRWDRYETSALLQSLRTLLILEMFFIFQFVYAQVGGDPAGVGDPYPGGAFAVKTFVVFGSEIFISH